MADSPLPRPRALISLVDDNPLLPALVARHIRPAQWTLVSSDRPNALGRVEEMAAWARRFGIDTRSVQVEDGSVEGARSHLSDAVGSADTLWIDVSTSGPALAAAAHAVALDRGVPRVFVDETRNRLHLLNGQTEQTEVLDVPITVADCLELHGRAIVNQPRRLSDLHEDACALSYYVGSRYADLEPLATSIRRALVSRRRRPIVIPSAEHNRAVEHLLEHLGELGAVDSIEPDPHQLRLELRLDHPIYSLFRGPWLEHYVYMEVANLVEDGVADDALLGVEFSWDADDPGANTNEIDVAFTMGDRLVIVECKSGRFDRRADPAAQLHRLVALRRYVGATTAEAVLVVAKRVHHRAMIRRRAREMDVALFDLRDLRDLDEHLRSLRPGVRLV